MRQAQAYPMQRVARDALRRASITPVICPLPTAVALVADAVSLIDRPADGDVRGAIRAHLRQRDIAALHPLVESESRNGSSGRPNEIVPVMPGATFDEQLDAVAAVDPDALAEAVECATEAGHPTTAWQVVVYRAPKAWLRAYASALRRAWEVIEPAWSRAVDILERDAERVGLAVARGAGDELVIQRFPFAVPDGEDVLLPSHSQDSGTLQVSDRLAFVPLLAHFESSGWTDDYGDRLIALRYPAGAAWSALDDATPPASLAALVGPQRARLLRWLERPATPGDLARQLQGAPSMVTHHLRALQAAGLIVRRRHGRHVRVTRTARGEALVALYGDD